LGIQYIKTLQEMPMELLFKTLQKPGIDLWKKAQGIDNRKVEPYQERKSIGSERTFEKDTIDVVKLRNIISAMAENLAYQLRKGDKLCACITVKVRYSDFNTHTLQAKIPYTSAEYTDCQIVGTVRQTLQSAFVDSIDWGSIERFGQRRISDEFV
jgi:DNA polymerase-4